MGEGAGALRELVAWLGFEVDDKGLKRADERLNKTMESVRRLGEAVVVAFAFDKVGEFLKSQIEIGAQLSHTSEMLGIGTGDLQAFQYAAETVGVGTEQANSALGHFSRVLGEARLGNVEATQTLAKLGFTMDQIKSNDLPMQIAQLSEGFAKLHGSTEQNAVSMKVLGRAAGPIVNLLKKGGDGVEKLYQEFDKLGGGMSEEFIAEAEEGEHQIVKFKTAMKGLSSVIAGPVISALTPMIDDFTQVAKWLRDMATNTPIVKTALVTLVGVSVALAAIWAVMNIEIFLIIAALALFVLAIEDLYVWLNGGKSVIGDFLDDMGGKGTSTNVRDFLKSLKQDFEQILDKVENELVPAVLELWQSFQSEDGKKSVHDFKDALTAAAEVAHDLAAAVATVAHWAAIASDSLAKLNIAKKGGKADEIGQMAGLPAGTVPGAAHGIGSVLSALPSLFPHIGEAEGSFLGKAFNAGKNGAIPNPFAASSLVSGAGGNPGDAVYSVQVTNHINGAGDPGAVAGKTGDATSNAIKSLQNAAFAGIKGGG